MVLTSNFDSGWSASLLGSFVSNAYVLMFIAAAAEKKTGAESTAVERALGRYLPGAPDREGGRPSGTMLLVQRLNKFFIFPLSHE